METKKPFRIIGKDRVMRPAVTLVDEDWDSPRDITTITITGPRAHEVTETILHAEQLAAELNRTKADYLALLAQQSRQTVYAHES